MYRYLILFLIAAGVLFADSQNQVFSDFTTPLPLPDDSTLIIGVVGGWERWDAPQRIVRRIALRIRDRKIPGVFAETVENHKLELADELIRKAFPDPENANIIIYGNSLGGTAAVRLAKQLKEHGVPVRLLIVIDGVGKNAREIPANVKAALNIYQRDSWPVVGQSNIDAEDPQKTEILGNRRFRYWGKDVDLETEPLVRRIFTRGHLKLEYDPEVWKLVEDQIISAIPAPVAKPGN